MRNLIVLFVIGLVIITRANSADLPIFKIEADEIENIVVDATPNKPWILSITLTEQKISEYKLFTQKHLDSQISLVVADIEIYRPAIHAVVGSNPITLRMFDKEKFISILSALPPDPEQAPKGAEANP